jgi:choline-glycine betaine transporter
MNKYFKELRIGVILAPLVTFALIIILGFVNKEVFIGTMWNIFGYVFNNFGWTLEIGTLLIVFFLLAICFLPAGRIRFGGKDAKPEMSRWNYWTIALCAGIGTGIMFWGAAEPLTLAFNIPQGITAEPGSYEAVMFAMTRTFLHWSITPYSIYAIVGLGVAYSVYNMKKPFNVSSGLVPLLGDRATTGVISGSVDALTIIAIIGGVGGGLGLGILQIGKGLEFTFGIQSNHFVWAITALIIIIGYTISSASGLDKGIKWLSDKNAWIFIGFLLIVIVFGPTKYIIDITLQGFGEFVTNFVALSTFTSPNNTDMWPQWWDMFYLAAWLAFGPAVGVFLARISYGRTIREFITINLLLPAAFGIIWFGAFGGFVLDLQFSGVFDAVSFLNVEGKESIMLKLCEFLPLTNILRPLVIATIALSFVTMADSMTSTISLMSLKNNVGVKEAPLFIKLFWGICIGFISYIFILNGGVDGAKIIMALSGFPILIIELLIMAGLFKKLVYNRDYNEDELANDKNEITDKVS